MADIIVNMTQILVTDEIENVLDSQAEKFYQKAFSLPDLRQELITYVLSRIPNLYSVIQEEQELSMTCNSIYQSAVKQLHIKAVIHQGCHDLLPRKEKLTSEETEPGIAPSNCFH